MNQVGRNQNKASHTSSYPIKGYVSQVSGTIVDVQFPRNERTS